MAFVISCGTRVGAAGTLTVDGGDYQWLPVDLPPSIPCATDAGPLVFELHLSQTAIEVDAVEVRSERSPPRLIEAESGLGTLRTGVSSAASGGLWVGTGEHDIPRIVRQSFRAERDWLSCVYLHLPISSERPVSIRASLIDLASAAVIHDGEIVPGFGNDSTQRFCFSPRRDSRGRLYELHLDGWDGPTALPLSSPGIYGHGGLRVDGVDYAEDLVFVPRYLTASFVLAVVSLPAMWLIIVLGFRGERAARFGFVVLLPLSLLASFAYWQLDFRFLSPDEWQPDLYDAFAALMRNAIVGSRPADLETLRGFLRTFPHAHSPLVPSIAGVLSACGLDVTSAFLVVAVVTSALGAIALRAALLHVSCSWSVAWAGVSFYLTHFLFLRSAVRTSTDAAGLAFGALILAAALCVDVEGRKGRLHALLVVGLAAVGNLIRPTVLPAAPAAALGRMLADGWVAGGGGHILRWASVALLPAVLFFAVVFAAGLEGSFAIAREKLHLFDDARRLDWALACLALLVQAVPVILGVALLRKQLAGSALRLVVVGLTSAAASLTFLFVSQAPMWSRHFAPALPGVTLCAAACFASSTLGRATLLLAVAGNLLLVGLHFFAGDGMGQLFLK